MKTGTAWTARCFRPISHNFSLKKQGTDPDYMWAIIVMLYWLKLAAGIIAGALTILWLVHVVLYIFLSPPLYPFLNTFFKAMDTVFPLFGTLAFAVFCFYLIGARRCL